MICFDMAWLCPARTRREHLRMYVCSRGATSTLTRVVLPHRRLRDHLERGQPQRYGIRRLAHRQLSLVIAMSVVAVFYLLFLGVCLRRIGTRRVALWTTLGALTYPLYLIHNALGKAIAARIDPYVGSEAECAARRPLNGRPRPRPPRPRAEPSGSVPSGGLGGACSPKPRANRGDPPFFVTGRPH